MECTIDFENFFVFKSESEENVVRLVTSDLDSITPPAFSILGEIGRSGSLGGFIASEYLGGVQ